jgi:hypothetical protein
MRTLAGEALGDCRADAARGARDQRDLAGEAADGCGYARTLGQAGASSDNCTEILPSSASAGRIG